MLSPLSFGPSLPFWFSLIRPPGSLTESWSLTSVGPDKENMFAEDFSDIPAL